MIDEVRQWSEPVYGWIERGARVVSHVIHVRRDGRNHHLISLYDAGEEGYLFEDRDAGDITYLIDAGVENPERVSAGGIANLMNPIVGLILSGVSRELELCKTMERTFSG
jgi:hypothetical protein